MLALAVNISQILSTTFNVLYVLAILSVIILLVLENRNPVKTVSWILVITFLPVIGLILYLYFGRDHRRQKKISRRSYSRLMSKPRAEYLAQESVVVPPDYRRLVMLFQNIDQSFPFGGNRVETYIDGESMLSALIEEIRKAENHIHMEYYIFNDDEVGNRVLDVLKEKAKEGVKVRVIYDDVGCWHVPSKFFRKMSDAGIEVRGFLKVHFPFFSGRVNYRNHRKLTVIDGKVGFVGGMNLADRYVKGVKWGNWRDTHLKIEGKAVHGLQTTFLMDWYFVDQKLLTSSEYFPKLMDVGSSVAQIVTSEPTSQWPDIMQGLVKAITGARKYFYVQTPYFLPTEPVLFALQTAALAGVDVRLMIPKKSDTVLPHLGTLSYLRDVLQAGVKVYQYQKGFIHSKLMVSDDVLVSVGSTNMDFRSFEHNFEVNAFVYDKEFAQQMKQVFIDDQADAVQVSLKEWKKRPWWERLMEGTIRLMAPLL